MRQALLYLPGKVSPHFPNSIYTNAVSVHVLLKQRNDLLSFQMKSEWLITVTYQLLKPKEQAWPVPE